MGIKISELAVSSKPINGIEILPIVQGASTKYASIDSLVSPILGTSMPQVSADTSGSPALTTHGHMFFDSLTVSSSQSLTKPIFIGCSGDIVINDTITSTAQIEIECAGNVTINNAISATYISIKAGGNITLAAAASVHASDGTFRFNLPNFRGSLPDGDILTNEFFYWRLISFNAGGNIVISAAVTADDIFMKAGGNLTISSTLTARWLINTGSPACRGGWFDGYVSNYANDGAYAGGGGGTGGGHGYNQADNSIWFGTHRPYLLPTLSLARGGFGTDYGSAAGDGQRGRGGGRISLYCDGNALLTSATLIANGGSGDEIGGGGASGGGGGGGTIRVVAKGTITNGTATANGGSDNDAHGGGGGGVYMIASAYSGSQTVSATEGGNAINGTTATITLSSSVIDGFKRMLIFEANTYTTQQVPAPVI